MSLAPVVIFTYKRLPVLRRVLASLLANPESPQVDLIAYSDGPKSAADREGVEEVRAFLRELHGFKSLQLKFREHNFGLARSFIEGIGETLAQHEAAIFLEDDNLLSPHFLAFMNESLARYAAEPRVICITGYSFPIWPKQRAPYFIRGAETWTMATWRRGWQQFEANAVVLKQGLDARNLRGKLDRSGFGFYGMLQRQIDGQIDSWGVRWWASAFLKDMYCLYPPEPLCVSIGYGLESVHCGSYSALFRTPGELATRPITMPATKVLEKASMPFVLRLMNWKLRLLNKLESWWPRRQ